MRQNAAAMSASVCIRAYAGPSRSSLSSVAGHAGPLPRLAGAGGRRRPRGPDPAGDILAVKAVLIAAGHTPDPYRGGAYPVGASFFTPASRPCLNLRDHSEGRLVRVALQAAGPTRDEANADRVATVRGGFYFVPLTDDPPPFHPTHPPAHLGVRAYFLHIVFLYIHFLNTSYKNNCIDSGNPGLLPSSQR